MEQATLDGRGIVKYDRNTRCGVLAIYNGIKLEMHTDGESGVAWGWNTNQYIAQQLSDAYVALRSQKTVCSICGGQLDKDQRAGVCSECIPVETLLIVVYSLMVVMTFAAIITVY